MREPRHEITTFDDGTSADATSIPGLMEVVVFGAPIEQVVEVDQADLDAVAGARARGDQKALKSAERAALRRGRRVNRGRRQTNA